MKYLPCRPARSSPFPLLFPLLYLEEPHTGWCGSHLSEDELSPGPEKAVTFSIYKMQFILPNPLTI